VPKFVLNLADLDFQPFGHGAERPGTGAAPEKYACRIGQIGMAVGAKKLGYNITILPPGKRAFPLHNHTINEEMFFILEGEGQLRVGKETFPVKQDDFIACPPGGPETAHQLINTHATLELRYLAVSTMMRPEIAEYPESGKFGFYGDLAPDASGQPRVLRHIARSADGRAYWEGE
jgi:uncharacterized cupin superfamily protein